MPQRSLPYNSEAESALLGACLLVPESIGLILEHGLQPESFYVPLHANIFAAMAAIYGRGEVADAVTVAEEMQTEKILPTLLSIESNTPSTKAERYIQIIDDHALLRKIIQTSSGITDQGYELPEDVRSFLDQAESAFFQLGQQRATDSIAPAEVIAREELDLINERFLKGLKTGFRDLDRILGGIQKSNLAVLGARPSIGKTSLSMMIALAAVEQEKTALFFSLEMSHSELAQRILAIKSRVDLSRFRTGLCEDDWFSLKEGMGQLSGLPLYLDDNPVLTINEIRSKGRRMKNLGLIVVDYIQLMTGKRTETRQVEVAEISRNLKVVARELDVPVLALSQLNRNVESRENKRPIMADLRDSGGVEADADIIMFLYRDEVYNPDTKDKGVTEVQVAKHRNGPLGKARLAFLPRYAQLGDLLE